MRERDKEGLRLCVCVFGRVYMQGRTVQDNKLSYAFAKTAIVIFKLLDISPNLSYMQFDRKHTYIF